MNRPRHLRVAGPSSCLRSVVGEQIRHDETATRALRDETGGN